MISALVPRGHRVLRSPSSQPKADNILGRGKVDVSMIKLYIKLMKFKHLAAF